MKILELKLLDKIIIILLILLTLASSGYVLASNPNTGNVNIVVKVDNKVAKKISLNKSSESEIYEFNFNENKGYIEVKDGKVRMLEMDKSICPNAICSDTGWINKTYQMIVCLPNNIVVTLEGNVKEEVDF